MSGVYLPAITFRMDAVGGDISSPRVCPPNALTTRSHVVLLIHGFNVNEENGRRSYERFVYGLEDQLAIPRDTPIADDRLIAVYWPGDADWSFASPLAYMRSIPRAKQIGSTLAQLLHDSAPTESITVDIVAHSLGCRLALEALLAASLMSDSRVHIDRIQLMAAAVPVFMLDDGNAPRLRAAFEKALGTAALSLWSGDDIVLSGAFPPGQTLAGSGEGFFPTALGHAAWPSGNELARLAPTSTPPKTGHGSYWGGDSPDISKFVATTAHDFLGLSDAIIAAPPERDIGERYLPVASSPPTRETPARETAVLC